MDDKLKDVMASTLAAIGMWVGYTGWMDAAMWQQWSGAIMMLMAVLMPYVVGKKDV